MPGRAPQPAARLLLLAVLLLPPGCSRRRPPAAPAAPLVEALVPLCRDLARALSAPELESLPPAAAAARLADSLAPHRPRLSRLRPDFAALPVAEQQRVFGRVSAACRADLARIYARLGPLTARFAGEDGRRAYREAVAAVIGPWRDERALWAFGLFSAATMEELEETLEGEGAGAEHERKDRHR